MYIRFFNFSEFFLFPPIKWILSLQIPLMTRPKCPNFSPVIQIPEMDQVVFTRSCNQLHIFVVVLLGVGQLRVDDPDRVDRAVLGLDPLHHHEPGHFRLQFVEHELYSDQRKHLETPVFEGGDQDLQAFVDVDCGQTESLVVSRSFQSSFIFQLLIIQPGPVHPSLEL